MVELKDELLTVAEAAARLKVTRHTIYRWIAEGRLSAVRYSPRVLRVRLADLEGHRGGRSASAVRERGVAYEPSLGRDAAEAEKEEREEVRRLMDRYRELTNRPRGKDEPPKRSPEALLRHVGVISEETGDELRRLIKEARDASLNDPEFSFDDPA